MDYAPAVHAGSLPTPAARISYLARPFSDLSGRDVHDLLALRADVFVVEQACLFLDPDGLDPIAWHVLGRDPGGVLGAYARIFLADPERPAHLIGRVVTHRVLRRSGEGRRLMTAAIEVCASRDEHSPIDLAAQAHLEAFYASLGFVTTSPRYLMDGIDHIDMRRPPAR